MPLDLSNLERAVQLLDHALATLDSPDAATRLSVHERETLRAGVIQSFEFTYELSWTLMQRRIVLDTEDTSVLGLPRKELFRQAARSGLIAKVEPWILYLAARNRTVHTYNADQALAVFDAAKSFLADARALLTTLRDRHD